MRILLGLSWWVDSAVAAYLLKQQWHEVIAWFMKNFANPENPHCHTREDRNMAIKVAHHLGIDTFIIFDFRKQYHDRIISYIYDGYKAWRTPNPDVLCNSLVKFDLFLEKWASLWCDAIATWHYARLIEEEWIYHLLKWVDTNKDQSYFLSGLNQQQLSHSLFPLWGYTKDQIRKIATDIWLPNADRKDSQWLCFIGKVPIKEFLSEALPKKIGHIVDLDWKTLWEHDWAHFVTIGQRTGLWLSGWPWYVIDKNTETNTIVVSKDQQKDLYHRQCTASWWHRSVPTHTVDTFKEIQLMAKIRYRQEDQACTLRFDEERKLMHIHFDQAQRAISPGQIIVIYHADKLIWQGTIETR